MNDDSKQTLHKLKDQAMNVRNTVTAKPENIVLYQFSDIINEPYKVATESLLSTHNVSDVKQRFMKLDTRACIDFLSQAVKYIE